METIDARYVRTFDTAGISEVDARYRMTSEGVASALASLHRVWSGLTVHTSRVVGQFMGTVYWDPGVKLMWWDETTPAAPRPWKKHQTGRYRQRRRKRR